MEPTGGMPRFMIWLVIHLKTIKVDYAVDLLSEMVRQPEFQTTQDSQDAINNLVEAAAMEVDPIWWNASSRE